VGAYAGAELVGFVNLAWDGGQHGFILDTCVVPADRRQGIASRLVARAVEVAQTHGLSWLHVDFEPRHEAFYRACGFAPTLAGLRRLIPAVAAPPSS
jgi:ribosomal protein S18 acetylase RimI-like enzyme